jgi:hypothetical protein
MSAMGRSRFRRIENRERLREQQAERERKLQEEKMALEWQLWQSQYHWHMATTAQTVAPASWLGMAPQVVHVQGGRICAFIPFSMPNTI